MKGPYSWPCEASILNRMKEKRALETDYVLTAIEILKSVPVLAQKIAAATGRPEREAERLLEEVLKFMSLTAQSNQSLSPPPIIDLAWHEFILCTREYQRVCQTSMGRFIHHQPGGSESQNRMRLKNALKRYSLRFGQPPKEYWGDLGFWGEKPACGACDGEREQSVNEIGEKTCTLPEP